MKSICSCTCCATVSCQVIIKLSDQVTACLSDPWRPDSSSAGHDDIEAYETQNKFLNSEIYQLTKWWRKSSEQEKALMVKVGLTPFLFI
uniref:Uncharacterized protein n=2 Tax=Oreochromis TaxID=8139 RepID=A0A669EEQ8_ORENI